MKKVKTNIKIGSKKIASRFFKQDASAWLLLLPALICLYFCAIRPQLIGLSWSFFDMKGYKIDEFVGLENYRRILNDTMFVKTLWNTCQYVIWSLLVGFLMPVIIAIILNEMVHFRNTMRVIVYLPSIMPAVAVSLLWYLMYFPDEGGLLNMFLSYWGKAPYVWLQDSEHTILYIVISMTWSGMGGTVIYYFASLQGVQRELFEAALLDGAGFFGRLKTVTIPHILPIALLFLVKQIIGVFQVMQQPLQMTDGGPNGASMSLGLMAYNYGFVTMKPQFAMALGVIMFLILVVFTLGYFKLDKKLSEYR